MKDNSLQPKIKTEAVNKAPARLEKLTRGGKISDRIMTAFGAQIEAFNTEGKKFFSCDSNIAEALKWAAAEENKFVFACGEFILNYYTITEESIDDTFHYICPSEILDIWVDSFDGLNYYSVLSCKDKTIRVLNDKQVVYEVKLDYNAHCFFPMSENAYDFVNKKEGGQRSLLMGMANGEVRNYMVNQHEAKLSLTIKPPSSGSKSEPVFIRVFRLSGKKKSEIIVARADGTLDVYSPKENPGSYERIATTELKDGLTGLEGVFFNDKPQMIVTTFSGKLIGLTLKSEFQGAADIAAPSTAKADLLKQIAALKAEVEDLDGKVAKAAKQAASAPGLDPGFGSMDNKLTYTLKKIENQGNRYEVIVTSQEAIKTLVVKKPTNCQLIFSKGMLGIVIENPPKVDLAHLVLKWQLRLYSCRV
jgi:hypothetical protein